MGMYGNIGGLQILLWSATENMQTSMESKVSKISAREFGVVRVGSHSRAASP